MGESGQIDNVREPQCGEQRLKSLDDPSLIKPYRSEFRRDYARVLHSASFRRLQNKTQLFPGYESDFFRNRLTHSLEVAQIARGIADKLRFEYEEAQIIDPDVCETAGLLHDIGHPPFGHNGERALDTCMRDSGGFEGNAQTLHIITRLEKKESGYANCFDERGNDLRCGLNLTFRTIGAVLKYDKKIPYQRGSSDGLIKGYYACDFDVVQKMKEALVGDNPPSPFKTIECQIMDIADDIAYSTYDLEDAFKAGFLTPFSMMASNDALYDHIGEKIYPGSPTASDDVRHEVIELFEFVWKNMGQSTERADTEGSDDSAQDRENEEIGVNDESSQARGLLTGVLDAYEYSEQVAKNGFLRTMFTSGLVNTFINGVTFQYDEKYPILSRIEIDPGIKRRIEILKRFTYNAIISSSMLRVVENRGYEIVTRLFEKLSSSEGISYLPEDYQELYKQAEKHNKHKRVVCDFIAGMTDRYALEFYERLFSVNPQTIFKPL